MASARAQSQSNVTNGVPDHELSVRRPSTKHVHHESMREARLCIVGSLAATATAVETHFLMQKDEPMKHNTECSEYCL